MEGRPDRPAIIVTDEFGAPGGDGRAFGNFPADALPGRPSTPDALVPATALIAPSDSDCMTGRTLVVDGGMAPV